MARAIAPRGRRRAVRAAPAVLGLLAAWALAGAASSANAGYYQSGSAAAATGFFLPIYYPTFEYDYAGSFFQRVQNGDESKTFNYESQVIPTRSSTTPLPSTAVTAVAEPYTIYQRIPETPEGTLVSFTATARGSATISASGNSIHGTAQAFGELSPVSYTYFADNGDAQITYNRLDSKATAWAAQGFDDFVAVTSGTHPVGYPVQITVRGALNSQVTDPEAALFNGTRPGLPLQPQSYTVASAIFSFGDASALDPVIRIDDGDGTVLPQASVRSFSRTVSTRVGDALYVRSSLYVGAVGIATSGFGNQGSDGIYNYNNEAFAGNTSSLNLDPITDGVTLVSAAGINYATQVPEPAAAGALIALAALVMLRRAASAR